MDEREFHRMLERFPVVRKRTHARVEWNSIYDEAATGKAHATLAGASGPQHATINDSDSLPSALTKFLEGYFASNDAAQIQREFEKAQLDFLSGLSLEDVDDLCAQFVVDGDN